MSTTLEHVKILSTAPWFDHSLGARLIEMSGGGNAALTIEALNSAGVTISRSGMTRIVEPLRSEYRSFLQAENPDLYASALGAFAQFALKGDTPVAQVMGRQGLHLTARTMSYIADRNNPESVRDLVDAVQESDGRRESNSAKVVVDILSTYLQRGDRLSEFMTGLELWVSRRRQQAVPYFERVLETDYSDKATCVAGHLLGVSRYSAGDLLGAVPLLQKALRVLRDLNDVDGLIMTLTTYGRVRREQFRNDDRTSDLEEGIAALEEALALSASRRERRPSVLRPLAQAYFDGGLVELAMSTIETAVIESQAGQEKVDALIAKAHIYRDAGDEPTYADALDEAVQEADLFEVSGMDLAKLLNIQAGHERRSHNWPRALDLAQQSLTIGRKLGDTRHIAHSAHTLASVYVDRSEVDATDADLPIIGALLTESRGLLVQIRDARGVEMVDRTTARYVSLIEKRDSQ